MTNDKQQTAVEWYGIQLEMLFRQYYIGRISITEFHTKRFEFEEQAKLMEKEQIKDAYWNGSDGIKTKTQILNEAEQFFNETYGGNK